MPDLKQNDDGSIAIYSDQEGLELFRVGGIKNPIVGTGGSSTSAATLSKGPTRGVYRLKLTLFNGTASITAANGLWQNTTDGDLLVGLTEIVVTTGQDVTFSISVGTGTFSGALGTGIGEAKGAFNNLIDTFNYNTANQSGSLANNINNNGTNGKATQLLPVGGVIGVQANRSLATAAMNLYVTLTKV